MKILMKILSILFIFQTTVLVYGQRDPVYSQYMFDKVLINPAYAGSSNWMVGSLKYRNHLLGIEGAPQTSLFTFHAPIQRKSMGMGLKAIYDQTAVTTTLTVSGIYSFHLGFGDGKLSFGLEGGMVYSSTDFQKLRRYDAVDPSIPETIEIAIVPDASFGIYYQAETFYAGASLYHLFNAVSVLPESINGEMIQMAKTAYLFGGYILDLNRTFALEPGGLLKYAPGVPLQADVNLNLVYNERITLGGSYRMGGVAAVLLKVDVTEGIRIAYSYDISFSNLSNFSTGSHEIMLSFGRKLLPPAMQKEVHPRYYF
jgi:type IX secretion system PorP/SprF family membrane protein